MLSLKVILLTDCIGSCLCGINARRTVNYIIPRLGPLLEFLLKRDWAGDSYKQIHMLGPCLALG